MNNTIEYDNVKNKLELSNIFDITEKYDDNGSQKTIVSPGTILRNMREQDKMSVRDTAAFFRNKHD